MRQLGDAPYAMMYRAGRIYKNSNDADLVAHVARAGAELGADIIKTITQAMSIHSGMSWLAARRRSLWREARRPIQMKNS